MFGPGFNPSFTHYGANPFGMDHDFDHHGGNPFGNPGFGDLDIHYQGFGGAHLQEEGLGQSHEAQVGEQTNGQEINFAELLDHPQARPLVTALGNCYDDLSNAFDQNSQLRFSSNLLRGVASSSSIWSLSKVSISNVAYLLTENPSLYDRITARIAYVEVGLMAVASFITRTALALLTTAIAIITLGQLRKVNNEMVKQWIQSALAISTFVTALVGIISPYYAAIGNAIIVAAPLFLMADELTTTTQNIYRNRRDEIQRSAQELLNDESSSQYRQYIPQGMAVLDGLFNYNGGQSGSSNGYGSQFQEMLF